ncbi:MAG: hypothetical protein RLZZ422_2929 [Pseudomonadota bacterium]|jgi:hypothetical protein
MVTKRTPQTASADAVERFVAGAEAPIKAPLSSAVIAPDPHSRKKHKAMTLPLNEYESDLLERAATKTGRSQLGYIRFVMLQQAKKDLGLGDEG